MSDVESLLRRNGWVLRRSVKHNVWVCPCGEHLTSLSKTSSDHRAEKNKLADLRRMKCPSLGELVREGRIVEKAASPRSPQQEEGDPTTVYACVICKREVTRRTSYALAPGKRACRHHPGVSDE